MRKIPLLAIMLFPYVIVITLICMFTISDTTFVINALMITLLCLYILSFVFSWRIFLRGVTKKKDAIEILRICRMIKLVQIPAYLLIFGLGLLCCITIFTYGVTIVLMILDAITISFSGLIGLGGVIGCYRQNKITLKKAIIYGFLQFIYCADVISTIIIYRRVKTVD